MSVLLPYVGWTMLRPSLISFATALSLLWSTSTPVSAQAIERLEDVVQVTFLEGWREQSGGHYAGIQIELADGWKTYWRAPGDGGIPTTIEWGGSENLRSARLFWPRPTVFRISGLRSVGYRDQVVIPIRVTPKQNGPITAQMDMRLGVCKDICVPVALSIRAELNTGANGGEEQIRAALADRPKRLETGLSCTLSEDTKGLRLDFASEVPTLPGKKETAVIELSDPTIWVSEPAYRRQGSIVNGSVTLVAQAGAPDIDLSSVRMTVLTTRAAVEVVGCKG